MKKLAIATSLVMVGLLSAPLRPVWADGDEADSRDPADEPVMVGGAYDVEVLKSDHRGFDAQEKPIPPELIDPAFERYVDYKLLRRAWFELDASALTDAALQLAEGERILLRPHKTLKSAELLRLAITAAANNRDETTLERLKKSLARIDDERTKSELTTALTLAAQTRATDPELKVPVENFTVEGFANCRILIRAIQAARMTGDRESLDAIREALESGIDLPAEESEYLLKLTSGARAAIAENAEPNETIKALNMLMAESRAVIDLTNSEIAKRLRDYLRSFAQGNEGDAGVDQLTYDVGAKKGCITVWIRHKHRPCRRCPVLYSLTQKVTFCVSPTEVNCTIDLGRGIRVSCRDIAKILKLFPL